MSKEDCLLIVGFLLSICILSLGWIGVIIFDCILLFPLVILAIKDHCKMPNPKKIFYMIFSAPSSDFDISSIKYWLGHKDFQQNEKT